jgi:hypothetical protein
LTPIEPYMPLGNQARKIAPKPTQQRRATDRPGSGAGVSERPVRLYAPRPSSPVKMPQHGQSGSWALRIIVAALVTLNVVGAPYYLLSRAERVRSIWHPWLKPSGYIGQSAGVLALSIFLFLWLYPLRKRFRWLAFTGAIARWLDVHVFVALALPLIVAIHASWHFTGVIGLGFWAMMVVWASGIAGRYIYARIPRSKAGIELSLEEIAADRRELLEQIALLTGLTPEEVDATLATDPTSTAGLGILGVLRRMIADDLARRSAARQLRRRFQDRGRMRRRQDRQRLSEALRLANREIALTQQGRMLDATQNLFRFWHVAHRPVAVAALVAVLVHVGVVVAMGATWFW